MKRIKMSEQESPKFYLKGDDIDEVRDLLSRFIKQKTWMDRLVCKNESLKECTLKMMEYIIENIVTLEEWKEFKKYQKMCHKEER
jgi:hypothetical protein